MFAHAYAIRLFGSQRQVVHDMIDVIIGIAKDGAWNFITNAGPIF